MYGLGQNVFTAVATFCLFVVAPPIQGDDSNGGGGDNKLLFVYLLSGCRHRPIAICC